MQDDVKVTHGDAELRGTLVAIAILEQSHPQCARVAGIQLAQCCIDRVSSLLDFRRAIRWWWGLGHGAFDDGVGLVLASTLATPGAVDIDGAVDGDAA